MAIAIAGDTVVVGAPLDDDDGYDSGSAYVFLAIDLCEGDLNDDGQVDMQDWFLFGQDWGRTDCPASP